MCVTFLKISEFKDKTDGLDVCVGADGLGERGGAEGRTWRVVDWVSMRIECYTIITRTPKMCTSNGAKPIIENSSVDYF